MREKRPETWSSRGIRTESSENHAHIYKIPHPDFDSTLHKSNSYPDTESLRRNRVVLTDHHASHDPKRLGTRALSSRAM
jgi:hypothetical protein